MLQAGPGPTVARAFQEAPYFAMVVQFSLLVWTFHATYLATAISDALRKRLEGAPPSSFLQNNPDTLGVLGVLNACESQTSSYNWNMLLDAVPRTLGYSPDRARIDIPACVLQGLLDMFPMAQTLPDDRFIHIQIPVGEHIDSGITMLVVWAHHVLDFTVMVRSRSNDGKMMKQHRFGSAETEQILIEEIDVEEPPSVILLDEQNDHLLTIKPEPDEDNLLIGAVRRIPARGWGNAVLADNLASHDSSLPLYKAVIEDLQVVVIAFAVLVARNLIKDDSDRDIDDEAAGTRIRMVYPVREEDLLRAPRFLFDNNQLSHKNVNTFVTQWTSKPLDDKYLPKPPALEAAARSSL